MKAVASTQNLKAVPGATREATAMADRGALRILHVIDRLDMGGTEYTMLRVMKGLNSAQFEQRICAARGFNEQLPYLREWRERIFVAGRPGEGFQFLVLPLMRIMKKFRPHIVHSRNWGAIEAIPAARLAGVPVVIHSEHGYVPDMVKGLPRRQRLLRRGAYAMADAIFAVTDELRSYHAAQAGVSAEDFRVIHNGVDTDRFAPQPDARRAMRQRMGISGGMFVAGIVSRLVPIKDHATLFRAVETLASRRMDLRVVVAGSGPELGKLQGLVSASPRLAVRVSFIGASENVPELLNSFDAFVLPSLTEGMSNTILEAMATGIPVIATRVGGNPELVQEGRTGMLFAPGDAAQLAAQLDLVAGNKELREKLGAEGRRRAVGEFSLDRMLGEYRKLYLELAARKGVLKEVRA
ncbi:MAG: glycosyltransferase [Candidatus Acidiferrales bacterium]